MNQHTSTSNGYDAARIPAVREAITHYARALKAQRDYHNPDAPRLPISHDIDDYNPHDSDCMFAKRELINQLKVAAGFSDVLAEDLAYDVMHSSRNGTLQSKIDTAVSTPQTQITSAQLQLDLQPPSMDSTPAAAAFLRLMAMPKMRGRDERPKYPVLETMAVMILNAMHDGNETEARKRGDNLTGYINMAVDSRDYQGSYSQDMARAVVDMARDGSLVEHLRSEPSRLAR
jgi:hypothetical protein